MIVFTGTMLAAAGISAAGSAIGATQNYMQGRDELARQNAEIDKLEQQDQMNFMRDMQAYQAYIDAENLAYMKDLENLSLTYELNGKARQRSIESGLTQLSDLSDNFVLKAVSRNKKLQEALGAAAATGQTGANVQRRATMQYAQAGSSAATDGATMEAAVGAFMFREKFARDQQEFADKNAYNSIRPPVFGPPPAPPQARTRPADTTGMNLAFDIAGGAVNALSAGIAQAPTDPFAGGTQFGTDSSLPTPSFSGNSAESLGFSPSVATSGSFYQNPTYDLTSLGINTF